jgi:hypothetical protein
MTAIPVGQRAPSCLGGRTPSKTAFVSDEGVWMAAAKLGVPCPVAGVERFWGALFACFFFDEDALEAAFGA